jgi:folate-binding protein YgfZ
MSVPLTSALLPDLGVIAARGTDARRFLQGQVSQDVESITADRVALAGYHNPQGRVLALLRLVPSGDDAMLAVLPRELVPELVARLRKFVLRSKVTIADESDAWRIEGLWGAGAAAALAHHDGHFAWSHANDPARWMLLSPAHDPLALGAARGTADAWRAADVAAGLPQVYRATSEAFVAQMLNLDVLQAISFTKGCYTGQEVIARAHYRGRVKRRLQRFSAPADAPLAVGAQVVLADGRDARIVEVAAPQAGGREFLAVTTFGAGASAEPPATEAAGSVRIESRALALPYALPD